MEGLGTEGRRMYYKREECTLKCGGDVRTGLDLEGGGGSVYI
jgi:hypothetical protein